MDFNYTVEPEDHPVYHVLVMCPEARKIKDKHHEYKKPPASEKRQPCRVCLDAIGDWLSEVKA